MPVCSFLVDRILSRCVSLTAPQPSLSMPHAPPGIHTVLLRTPSRPTSPKTRKRASSHSKLIGVSIHVLNPNQLSFLLPPSFLSLANFSSQPIPKASQIGRPDRRRSTFLCSSCITLPSLDFFPAYVSSSLRRCSQSLFKLLVGTVSYSLRSRWTLERVSAPDTKASARKDI